MPLDNAQIMYWLGLLVVVSPVALFCILGVSSLTDRSLSEQRTSRAVQVAVLTGLIAAVVLLGMMLPLAQPHVPISLGNWVDIGHETVHASAPAHHDHDTPADIAAADQAPIIPPHYHFSIKFIFDRLSVPFVILTYVLCGTIGAFATRYMHREPGYNRFFFLYAMFLLGMMVTSLAGTIETLFAGWELVGLSSALLVAFFHDRTAPVRNGLRVWCVYRVSDAALLIAALTMHHMTGEGDFEVFMGKNSCWPTGLTSVEPLRAFFVGMFLLLAAAGKSALVPFSGWLPRAMEGPTPSSAIFYGALSVHLGAFLLLRFSPLLDRSPALCVVVTTLGLITAVYAFLAGRVQTDIKSDLCFASLTQVGIIVAEIGIGLRYIPLIHILGHGCLRTLQFVRAPTILQDYRLLENAIGDHLPHRPSLWKRMIPVKMRYWLYRFALERGYLDSILNHYVVVPVLRMFRFCDRLERRWTNYLSGKVQHDTDQTESNSTTLEDL